jgi:hypothetical protein
VWVGDGCCGCCTSLLYGSPVTVRPKRVRAAYGHDRLIANGPRLLNSREASFVAPHTRSIR